MSDDDRFLRAADAAHRIATEALSGAIAGPAIDLMAEMLRILDEEGIDGDELRFATMMQAHRIMAAQIEALLQGGPPQ